MQNFKIIPMPVVILFACIGAGLSVVADIFSGYSPNAPLNSMFISIQDIKNFGTAKSLFQLEVGQYIAFISIPLSSLIIIPICQGIKKSKLKLLKSLFVMSYVLTCFLGLAFHTIITIISFIFIKEQQGQMTLSSSDINFMTNLFNIVVKGSIIFSMFSMGCFLLIVWRSNTVFTKLAAIVNPVLLTSSLIILGLYMPAPYSVFLYIVSGNLGLLIWYLLLFGVFVKKPKIKIQKEELPSLLKLASSN